MLNALHGYAWSPMWGRGAVGFPLLSIAGILLALGLLALVITAIVVIARRSRTVPPAGESLEILRTRYARGELSKEQYEEMRRTLST